MKEFLSYFFETIDPFFISEWRFLVTTCILFFLCSSILVPPSEALAASSGAVLARYDHHFLFFLLAAVLFYHLGSCLWYLSGRRRALGGRPRGEESGEGKKSESRGEGHRMARWLQVAYGASMTKVEKGIHLDGWRLFVVLRNVPVIRSVVSFPAGAAGLSGMRFHLSSLVGILIWVLLWSLSGFIFGKSLESYAPSIVIALFLLFCLAATVYMSRLGTRLLERKS
jgi:membrane protein DedA with SNARE-associated domain